MAPGQQQEPLLVPENTSETSPEDALDEEDALLADRRTNRNPTSRLAFFHTQRFRELVLFLWALAATTAVIILAVLFQHNNSQAGSGHSGDSHHNAPHQSPKPHPSKRNLIFMVSDGMGPSSLSLTRTFYQHTNSLPWNATLHLDQHLIGQSRTRSSNSWVTDSAAGATAFACGEKSYNGAISVLPDFTPCGSVMEAAKRAGYTTGLVVTTRVTDATPATFVSHVRRREMEDEIAVQMVGEAHPLGRMVDLVVGGGRCKFLPSGEGKGGCRRDGRDVVKSAKENGWTYVETRREFEELGEKEADLPLLALLAERDVPYEIDRQYLNEEYLSLEEMTKGALKMLAAATRESEKGFFVMIEGSRIDHAGHANDPATQVREVLAYDRAMAAVQEFIDSTTTPTLMVATSDHETGGLAVARQLHPVYPAYKWYPEVLANASHSAHYASHQYHEYLDNLSLLQPLIAFDTAAIEPKLKKFITKLAAEALGITDITEEEFNVLISYPEITSHLFADMVSRRAQIGWSTHGHTAADVNIYSSDPEAAAALCGNHENTEVGAFLRSYLDLDNEVEKVTKELRKHIHKNVEGISGSWLGPVPSDSKNLVNQADSSYFINNYHIGVWHDASG